MAGNKVKIDLVADTKQATAALKKFTTGGLAGFKNLAKGMSTATKVALGVAVAVVAIGAVMIKLAKTIKEGTDEWAKHNDEIAKNAVQLGIATEALQEWNFIAERAGVSQSELSSAFTLLQRNLAEAADGTAAQADALAKINLEASDLQNMRLEDSFKLIMERVAGLNTESEKSQVLMDLMGRSGSKLKTIVAGAGDGIDKLSKRFKELGGAIPKFALEDAEEYQDAMLDLSVATKGLSEAFWRQLGPSVTWVVGHVTTLIVKFRELMGLGLESDLKEQQQALQELNEEFLRTTGFDKFSDSAEGIVQLFDDIKRSIEQSDGVRKKLDWGYGDITPTPDEIERTTNYWEKYFTGISKGVDLEKEIIAYKQRRAGIDQKILDLQVALGQATRGKIALPTPEKEPAAKKGVDQSKLDREAAALAAMNNARRISIALMTDEREKAKALLDEKLVDIELEFNAKVEKHGQFLSFIDEANIRELEARQEHSDAITAIKEAEVDRELEILYEAERQRSEIELAREAAEAERAEKIKALQDARMEGLFIDMDAQIARTGAFYQTQLEQAREAGASEMELEKMKRNMKKDMGMAALADAQAVALQFAAQSKNAWRAYKAAAIAQTIISTFKSAQSSYEALAWIPLVGPALGAAAAAVALVAGFARVQSIRKQERPSAAEGGVFSGPTGGYPATLHGTEAVVPLPGGRAIPVEGAGGGTMVVNIQAVDSQSIVDLMSRNPQAIIGPMVEQMQLGNRNLISTMQNTTREE